MTDNRIGISITGKSNYYIPPKLDLETKKQLDTMKLGKEIPTKNFKPSVSISLSIERKHWFSAIDLEITTPHTIQETNPSGWGGDHGYKGIMDLEKSAELYPSISAGFKYPLDNYKDLATEPRIGASYTPPHTISTSLSVKKGFYDNDNSINIKYWDTVIKKDYMERVSRLDIFTGIECGTKKGLMGVSIDGGITLNIIKGKKTQAHPYFKFGLIKKFSF